MITRAKISWGESIEDAALIRGRRLLTFLSQMWRFFEGGAYSSKYGIAIGLKEFKCLQLPNPNRILYIKKKIEFFMYLYFFRVKKTFSVYGVMSLLMPSSETQEQLEGAGKSLNGREKNLGK